MTNTPTAARNGERRTHPRCAIYTRKSSEEGLELDFNSLHAQREACEAFMRSQAHEGWKLIHTRFDDGGYSGGTLERPALQELLQAIRQQRIDIIVIYKIDRLSRSLMDFARLAELFDAHGVSFVSVTQPFNTTTSMGRLMLNVLLSFAQFEREITGERIRDKIAASKKKGLWMGGNVPLGYDLHERALRVNETEAAAVRTLFALYVTHGCVRAVQLEAQRLGLRSRQRTLASGRVVGGIAFGRGHLYRILNNPLYIGRIAHKGESYPGAHPPLIDQVLWDAVRAGLAHNAHQHRTRTHHPSSSLLAGLVVDAAGVRFRVTQTAKRERRYRYYTHPTAGSTTSQPHPPVRHVPAADLERLVLDTLSRFLASPVAVLQALALAPDTPGLAHLAHRCGQLCRQLAASSEERVTTVRTLLTRVVLTETAVCVSITLSGLRTLLGYPKAAPGSPSESHYDLEVPVRLRSRTGQARLVLESPDAAERHSPDPGLIRTLARSLRWWSQLQSGEVPSVRHIALAEQLSGTFVTRVLRLAFLAPDIVESILRGEQPRNLTARGLIHRGPLPLDWANQRRVLGLPPHR